MEVPDESIDLLVSGTPCQGFSVAGRGEGLDDARSNLAIRFVELVRLVRPRWVVWENVPGAKSTWSDDSDYEEVAGVYRETNDLRAITLALEECGYQWAWRILDAQYFGVPQRRRRIFLVGYIGDWRPPAAVLFEPGILQGNPPPSKKAGHDVAGTIGGGSGKRGWCDDLDRAGAYIPEVSKTLMGTGNCKFDPTLETYIPEIANPVTPKQTDVNSGRAGKGDMNLIAFGTTSKTVQSPAIAVKAVRRLTPRECERLQGLPDDYTLIPYRGKPAKDGPRYRAIGNAIAIPVLRWIGRRIGMVDRLKCERQFNEITPNHI